MPPVGPGSRAQRDHARQSAVRLDAPMLGSASDSSPDLTQRILPHVPFLSIRTALDRVDWPWNRLGGVQAR
jgi:hypothetical protein